MEIKPDTVQIFDSKDGILKHIPVLYVDGILTTIESDEIKNFECQPVAMAWAEHFAEKLSKAYPKK